MCTSFDFVFFSLGGTEVLTELAACACTISPSLFGSYKWDEITGKFAKIENMQEILSTLKWNIMVTTSIFPHNECMQWQGMCQYLCCLLLLSRSSIAGEVRWQGLCKLLICHWLLSKELQTKLWPWENSNIMGQTQFRAWVCATITHTVTSLAQVPDTTKNNGVCSHWLIHVSDKLLYWVF